MSDSENVGSAKVGDVRKWREVPSGALVRTAGGDFALRTGDDGHWVRLVGEIKMDWARAGSWGGWNFDEGEVVDEGPSTIIALGLTGQESAADLQRLAEVFEIWEHIADSMLLTPGADRYAVAERLHVARFRHHGMTAQDAALLLAEADNTRTE